MEISAFLPQEMQILLDESASVYLAMYLRIDTATLKAKKTRTAHLVRQAEQRLDALGWREGDVNAIMTPVRDALADDEFWCGRRGMLALFRTPNTFHVYQIPLPGSERVVVGHSFFIKPLLPLLAWARPFYVLAASQHRVRLLDCTFERAVEMQVEGMPHNLNEALSDEDVEKERQMRTVPATFGTGKATAIGYGEGGHEIRQERIERYLRVIDGAVHQALNGARTPLVFAGVEYLFPMYQHLTEYPALVPTPLQGNPDRMNIETLHKRAVELLQGYKDEPKCKALATYQELSGTTRVLSDTESILHAAWQGRVETLLLDKEIEEWGTYDASTGQMALYPDAEQDGTEMSNLAATLTLRSKGTAFALEPQEMPAPTAMAAILRY